jgi:subtilase family serine protease
VERVVAGTPSRPAEEWAQDTALAAEWAHAIATDADILVVQAPRATYDDLFDAVDLAVTRGAKIVVMNWSSEEFPSEIDYDRHFNHPGVTFVAASGDRPGIVGYPAASPRVLSVGGTSLNLQADGSIRSETPWLGGGWGTSIYEGAPGYQRGQPCVVNSTHRNVPDVAYSADPWFGYAVYSSSSGHGSWFGLGGTSAGAPQWAALLALAREAAGGHSSRGLDLASRLYLAAQGGTVNAGFRDLVGQVSGMCAASGRKSWYAPVTGLGSPIVDRLVPLLGREH